MSFANDFTLPPFIARGVAILSHTCHTIPADKQPFFIEKDYARIY